MTHAPAPPPPPFPPSPPTCSYTSLFSSSVNLLSALEEGRPLLMVAVGAAGIAPLRAALSWTPVLAHATTQVRGMVRGVLLAPARIHPPSLPRLHALGACAAGQPVLCSRLAIRRLFSS